MPDQSTAPTTAKHGQDDRRTESFWNEPYLDDGSLPDFRLRDAWDMAVARLGDHLNSRCVDKAAISPEQQHSIARHFLENLADATQKFNPDEERKQCFWITALKYLQQSEPLDVRIFTDALFMSEAQSGAVCPPGATASKKQPLSL